MRDPQRIVDEIQAFLMASDQTLGDRHPELAKEYREACEEINKRLVRCASLLRQGLRAEALHAAEAEPNVLTALQTLDFPERVAWLDVVGIYQLASPPDFEHGVAEHLSAAYAEHDPLRNLLRKHRRLALARAPLRERLAVVRELARVDSTNPIWDDDRRAYEMARFKQIHTEAIEAARQGDSTALDVLEHELLNDTWAIRPPNSLIQGVSKAAESVRRDAAKKALPAVEARLNDAFSALDVVRAREERARWISLAEVARLSHDHPLRERVEPALLWIDKEDEKRRRRAVYDAEVAKLTQALDDPSSSIEQLERIFAALTRAEQDLSDPPGHEPLSLRYRTRLANINLTASRRRGLIVGAGLAATLLLGVTSWLVYRSVEQASARSSAAQALDSAIGTGRIDEIEALLAQLTKNRPELLNSVELQARLPLVEKARKAESDRRLSLAEKLREAEDAPPSGREPDAIEAARKLAHTEEEKRSIESMARRLDRRDRDIAAETDRRLLPELDDLNKEIDAIEVEASDESRVSPELIVRLTKSSNRLIAAVPKSGPVSELARTRSEALRQRITASLAELDRIGRKKASDDRITEAVRRLGDDPQVFITALADRVALFGGEVREMELKTAISDQERAGWEAAVVWFRQSKQWNNDATPLDPDSARRRIEFCRGYLKQYPKSPNADLVAGYIEYLEPISLRGTDEKGLCDQLAKVLSHPSIDPLYMIEFQVGSGALQKEVCHYCAERVPEQGTISGVEFRVSYDGRTERKTLPAALIKSRELSPQSKWAQGVKKAAANGDLIKEWDRGMIDWARKAAIDPKMDPICKLIVLDYLLELAGQGSLALRETLPPTLAAIKRADQLTNLQWLDPEKNLDQDRLTAQRVIESLPNWDSVLKATQSADLRLRRSVSDPPRPVGWLARHRPGWRIRYSDETARDAVKSRKAELVVVVDDGKRGEWVPLGTPFDGADGAVALNRSELGIEGRLVFIRSLVVPKRRTGEGRSGE